jgi:hypothetical protein
MPSFLMDLALEIETRLGVDKQLALQLAEQEAARLRARFGRDALGRPEVDAASVLFQHRNAYKWDDLSQRCPEFTFEKECFDLLRELDRRWDGTIAGRRR